MILHKAQKIIAKDRHRFRVLRCGRRFGKTTLAVEEIFTKAFSKNDVRIAFIAPTFQQARDIAWEMLKKRCLPIATNINETRLEIKIRTQDGGESFLCLRGWEARETLRGQAFDMVVLDEIREMREFWLGWYEILEPTLLDRRGEAMFISTPNGFDHFYDLCNLELKDTNFKSFHFSSYDNPSLPLEELEQKRINTPEDKFSQEYLAEFRKKSGLVYPEFNRETHLFDDFNIYRKVERIAGIDFGFTNPSVILVIDRDEEYNYWLRHEWYKTGKTNAELIEVAKTLNVNVFYPDPAEPDRIEEMIRAGLSVRDVIKDIPKRIDVVRTLLKANKLRIHKDCINTIAEIETYSWAEKQVNKNEPEVPVKEHDHAMDAMGYALTMHSPTMVMENAIDFNLYSQSTYE